MGLSVYLFLLVFLLLLFLALLWCLDWLHVRPSSSKGVAKRSTLLRRLQPRTPDDCPCSGYVRCVTHDEIADAVG